MNKSEIIRSIAEVINKHSLENLSNTPDFILAEYLFNCLESFCTASNQRESWYGIRLSPAEDKEFYIDQIEKKYQP